jgi:FLVCR family MFS transporter 7
MCFPSQVAAAWFPDNQRALATTIGVMSNPLGVLLANVIAPALVTATEHVPYLNTLTAVPAVVTCILANVCVRRSEPPVPPTQSAATREMPFFEGKR